MNEAVKAEVRKAHHELVEVAQSAATIGDDLRSYEELSGLAIYSGLMECVLGHVDRALTVADKLFNLFDEEDEPRPEKIVYENAPNDPILRTLEMEMEEILNAANSGRRNVADLTFVAKCELKGRRKRVVALSATADGLYLLAEFDDALRRVTKTLTAIEQALAKAESIPHHLDFETELEISLKVRKAYTQLRKSIAKETDPDQSNIYPRLRAAGTQLAILVGHDVYPKLRTRDRVELKSMQTRILDWMRDKRQDALAGLRIWQDMLGVADMLSHVSRRQELVQHDAEKVDEIKRLLTSCENDLLNEEAIALIKTIEGLDQEIDELLASEDRLNPEKWQAPVDRLLLHFSQTSPEEADNNPMFF
jgi:hypothetical protein